MHQAFFFEFLIVLWRERPLSEADCIFGWSTKARGIVLNRSKTLAYVSEKLRSNQIRIERRYPVIRCEHRLCLIR